MSNNSTTISTLPQSPAEYKALLLLRQAGYDRLQQIDFLCHKDGQWMVTEVKERELYQPGANFPHYGTGLDISQLWLREQLRQSLGLRTYLLVYEKGTDNIYGQFLDVLEKQGDYFDTRNHIRIYPITHFTQITGTKGGLENTCPHDFMVNASASSTN
jgi:hypothetical protein